MMAASRVRSLSTGAVSQPEILPEARNDRVHLARTAWAVDPTGMAVPNRCLPVIGCNVRALTHAGVVLEALDNGQLPRPRTRQGVDARGRNGSSGQKRLCLFKRACRLRHVAKQMRRGCRARSPDAAAARGPVEIIEARGYAHGRLIECRAEAAGRHDLQDARVTRPSQHDEGTRRSTRHTCAHEIAPQPGVSQSSTQNQAGRPALGSRSRAARAAPLVVDGKEVGARPPKILATVSISPRCGLALRTSQARETLSSACRARTGYRLVARSNRSWMRPLKCDSVASGKSRPVSMTGIAGNSARMGGDGSGCPPSESSSSLSGSLSGC